MTAELPEAVPAMWKTRTKKGLLVSNHKRGDTIGPLRLLSFLYDRRLPILGGLLYAISILFIGILSPLEFLAGWEAGHPQGWTGWTPELAGLGLLEGHLDGIAGERLISSLWMPPWRFLFFWAGLWFYQERRQPLIWVTVGLFKSRSL